MVEIKQPNTEFVELDERKNLVKLRSIYKNKLDLINEQIKEIDRGEK